MNRHTSSKAETNNLKDNSIAPPPFLAELNSFNVPERAQRVILDALEQLSIPTVDRSATDLAQFRHALVLHLRDAIQVAAEKGDTAWGRHSATTGLLAGEISVLAESLRDSGRAREVKLAHCLFDLADALNSISKNPRG